MKEHKQLNPAIMRIIIVVLIGLITGGVYVLNSNDADDTTQPELSQTTDSGDATTQEDGTVTDNTTETTSESTNTAQSVASASEYKDGTYTATGSYSTPGGTESVTVTVTLSDDTVTNVSATGSASRGDSAEYQSRFLSAFKDLVVGKDIDDVSLSRVSGSSLTSSGFNRAIVTIRNDART